MKKLLIAFLCSLSIFAEAADVRLRWNPNPPAEMVTSYTIQYKTTSGGWNTPTAQSQFANIAAINGVVPTTVTLNGFPDGSTYYFVIKASNSTGDSLYSAELSHTFPAAPPTYEFLAKTAWQATASSQEVTQENNGALLAIDGNPATFWHTQWGLTATPHFFSVDLGKVANITGISYLPRQDGGLNGMIRNYDISVSNDGQNWTVAATGEFENNATERIVVFPSVETRYVRLIAKTDWPNGANGRASIAEFGVIGAYIPVLEIPTVPTGFSKE